MTEGIPPRTPALPREEEFDFSEEKRPLRGGYHLERKVSEVAFSAFAGAGSALVKPTELDELERLGCPLPEACKIIGKGYIEEYKRNLEKDLPQPAAEALLVLRISQDLETDDEFRKKISPGFSEGGTGGVYFLKNFKGEISFVFKPKDEEPFMPAWPKSAVYSDFSPAEVEYPIRLSVKRGSGSQNEVLASEIAKLFRIDVPNTYLVDPFLLVRESNGSLYREREDDNDFVRKVRLQVKEGSLQEFKPGNLLSLGGGFREISKYYQRLYGGLEKSIQVVDRLILFDCICGNADRNLGNALYDLESQKIYPIDHGLCFPDGLTLSAFERRGSIISETTFRLPQLSLEEGISHELQEFCASLEVSSIEECMVRQGAEKSSIEEMKLRALLVKNLARRGVAISSILNFFRQKEAESCPIEIIANSALKELGVTEFRLRGMSEEEKTILSLSYEKEFERQIGVYLDKHVGVES